MPRNVRTRGRLTIPRRHADPAGEGVISQQPLDKPSEPPSVPFRQLELGEDLTLHPAGCLQREGAQAPSHAPTGLKLPESRMVSRAVAPDAQRSPSSASPPSECTGTALVDLVASGSAASDTDQQQQQQQQQQRRLFVADAPSLKRLFKLPYSRSSCLMSVHRVGNTLVIDGEEMVNPTSSTTSPSSPPPGGGSFGVNGLLPAGM